VIGNATISKRLKEANKTGITAKNSAGHICKDAYFSETDVREACKDELKKYLQADEKKFVEIKGALYAAVNVWSKFFREKEGIVISYMTISKRLKKAGKTGITAKTSNGHIHQNAFFSETDVREACKDKLKKYHQANEKGFIISNNILYASATAWSKFFKEEGITISSLTISKRLKKANKIGITAKDSGGKIWKNAYFSESDVYSACADLLRARRSSSVGGAKKNNPQTS